jgi:hypothetical protein
VETPKRLTPSPDVTRRLYLASGNRCAYPQCDQALMGADAVLVGQIAHIEGALPDSARFNPKMCLYWRGTDITSWQAREPAAGRGYLPETREAQRQRPDQAAPR